MLKRRKQFWQRIVIFAIVVAAMVLAVLASRDTQHLRAVQQEGATLAGALQEAYVDQQEPPLLFPTVQEPHEGLHRRYFFNMFYAGQREGRQQVGVCCLKEPVRFFVLTEGRVVILFDGKHFSSRWLSEADFQAAAGPLGFDSSLLEK
jgi:hypothetical protein